MYERGLGPYFENIMRSSTDKMKKASVTIWNFLRRSPLGLMLIYMAFALQFQENYPLSHYPMYSNPSAERPYYYITDGDGKPVPVADLTGISSPKVGKRYRTFSEDEAKRLKIKGKDLPPEGRQAAGERIFTQLREGAARRKKELPDKLQLVRAELSYENGQIRDNIETIARE